jgi:alcohol dehydrogenase/propanol-preferring alcohol dehydrogenase
MQAWMVVKPSAPLESFELPTPEPKGTEVLIEVTHCGICHSDLHFWKGEYDMGGGKIMKITDRGVTLPRAPGHEIAGRVARLGPQATGVEVGDVRVVYPWTGCGTCKACTSGDDNLCLAPKAIGVVHNGGFGSHVIVPHARFLADPGTVDLALAATYACSGLSVHAAVKKLPTLDPDQPVVLIGAGGLGLLAIAMLQAFGHRNIVSVDIDATKRAAALEAGATHAIDGNPEGLAQRINAACGGGAPAVMDFVNNPATARIAFDVLGKGGTLVMVGVAGGDMPLSLAGMIFRALTIKGSNTGTPADLRAVLALANEGRLKPTPVQCCPADQANQALLDLKAGRVMGRAVLVRP